jgi:adenylate cyclase
VERAPLPNYLAAFEALERQAPQAQALFAQLESRWPEDPLVRLHHGRLLAGEQGNLMVMREK